MQLFVTEKKKNKQTKSTQQDSSANFFAAYRIVRQKTALVSFTDH